jgi:serine protease Do
MNTKSAYTRGFVGALAACAIVAGLALSNSPRLTFAADKDAGIQHLRNMSDAFVSIAENASPAVVYVEVESQVRSAAVEMPFEFPDDLFERFFGPQFREQMPQQPGPRRQFRQGAGSGFIISEDGYILTNNHVVANASRISVEMADGREFKGEVVGTDPPSDVAVVKIDGKDLPHLKLGDSDSLRVGEIVLAIGNPLEQRNTVTQGIVSAKGRSNVGITDFADFIQTDAAINLGNSGGPLLNLDGEVVGMNTAIMSRTGGSMGIGFAIPINMVKGVKDTLIAGKSVERGFLGVMIQDVTPEIADYFGVEPNTGAVVAQVNEDSPAAKAGIKSEDIVLEYNGESVHDASSLRNLVAQSKPESTAKMIVLRDGKRINLDVDIGKRDNAQVAALETPGMQEGLGLQVQNLTPELSQRFGFTDQSGVVVAQVEPGSPADRAGIQPGNLIQEVNRKPVGNTQQFRDALADSRENVTLVKVFDGQFSRIAAIRSEE